MTENVEITFISEQKNGSESDKTRLKAKGSLEKTDSGYVLTYSEPDKEMGDTVSELHIHSKNFVELKRTGLYETIFLIEENTPHTCNYKMPFGETEMKVSAKKVVADVSLSGGRILLNYTLESGETLLGEMALSLYIKSL